MNNKLGLLALVVAVLACAGVGSLMVKTAPAPLGAVPGGDFFIPVSINSGLTNSTNLATTSQGDVTLTAAQLRAWTDASLVSFSPGLVAGTALTLPASSTLAGFMPRAGDSKRFCVQNATSTAAVQLTFTGGTGTKLLVASSTATAVGSSKLLTGKIGCFTMIREVASSTANDFDVLMTTFL